jgi:hypothetical protein
MGVWEIKKRLLYVCMTANIGGGLLFLTKQIPPSFHLLSNQNMKNGDYILGKMDEAYLAILIGSLQYFISYNINNNYYNWF